MKKYSNSEELQSRRDFFKKAAKAALPILGAVVLANAPILTEASNTQKEQCSCSGGCSGNCYGSCFGRCDGSCQGNCYSSCQGSCRGTCQTGCTGCRGLNYSRY